MHYSTKKTRNPPYNKNILGKILKNIQNNNKGKKLNYYKLK